MQIISQKNRLLQLILAKQIKPPLNVAKLLTIVINVPSIFALPEGFVYLKEVNPTIIENLRYFSNENFIGRKIDGYKANRVILTYEAAKALSKVQQELLKDGYSLVIYNAYMPKRATQV